MLRIFNLLVVVVLVSAAAYVYKIKYESTLNVAQVAKLRAELDRERNSIAALRAEWSKLDAPQRIQALAQRHLTLRPLDVTQYDTLERLPDRPIPIVPPGTSDPIGAIIETYADTEVLTGSLPAKATRR